MLFNSTEFLSWFLPCTVIGFFLLSYLKLRQLSMLWLIAASLLFYSWWKLDYVLVLIGSMAANYFIGHMLSKRNKKPVLIIGIIFNLSLLGYFKYVIFFSDIFSMITGIDFALAYVALPLGISFFTFQQIAYLVDTYEGITKEHDLIKYALFVTFFPQLIAGPIVHHREIMPQFDRKETFLFNIQDFSVGITLFTIGLFKKVVIADNIAIHSDKVFFAASSGAELTFFVAWAGAVAFTLQLYFDFSAYSEMAIGLGRIFGVHLPINFNSPYKAASIIEFWRRWHMTLTRFLMSYLYNPVVLRLTRRRHLLGKDTLQSGAPKVGPFIVLLAWPTLLTMFLAGVWHGAGFQFMIFGVLHGSYIVANHAWRGLWRAAGWRRFRGRFRFLGVFVTFASVVVSLVFFRAENLAQARVILEGMSGVNGVAIPATFRDDVIQLSPKLVDLLPFEWTTLLSSTQIIWLASLMVVVWVLPNPIQWLGPTNRVNAHSTERVTGLSVITNGILAWRPTWYHGAIVGGLAAAAIMRIASKAPSEFLYFSF